MQRGSGHHVKRTIGHPLFSVTDTTPSWRNFRGSGRQVSDPRSLPAQRRATCPPRSVCSTWQADDRWTVWHETLGSESWRAYQRRWCGKQLSRVAANKLPRRARQSARSASRKPTIVMFHAGFGAERRWCWSLREAYQRMADIARLSTLSIVPKLRPNLSTGSDQRIGNKPSPPALFTRPDSASAPPRASGSYRLAASWNVARNPGCRALRREAAQR